MISEARNHGIRLILSLSNNYHDYGGRPQYVQWARNAGVPIKGDDDFYINTVVINTYRVPSGCFCSWLMPALSLYSVLCHILQNKPSSPYIWKWMQVKLNWRMERGLYHTLHRTPVSLPQTSLVPLPSLPAIYSLYPGTMSPRLLSLSPPPPHHWNSTSPLLVYYTQQNKNPWAAK